MKKIIAILLTLALVFAMGAVTVFAAAPVSVTESGITTVASGIVYQGNSVALADPVRVTLTADLVLDGSTFETGAILEVNAAGFNVTIKNCNFTGSVGAYNYACAITNAGNVTIENNIVNGSWRAFNVSIKTSASKLTAVGNSITLTKLTDPLLAEKNVGIQVYGGNWEGANIIINGNTFKNATTAFRLHNTFAFATGHENDVIVLGKNTLTTCVNFVGTDPDQNGLSPAVIAALAAALGNVNTIATDGNANTDVTANAAVTYMVIIPSSVNFGTISKTMPPQSKPFNVSVEGALVGVGSTITVANTTTSLVMKDQGGTGTAVLPFALGQYTFAFAYADLTDGVQTIESTMSCTPSAMTAAGSYSGVMTFSVSYSG